MPKKSLKILIVDDEAAMREVLELRLQGWGYKTATAADGEQAREAVKRFKPHLVISDVMLPDLSGLELLETLRLGDENRPVILITAYGTIDTAVDAIKKGAFDFLTKPLDYKKLRVTLNVAGNQLTLLSKTRSLEAKLRTNGGLGALIGASRPMHEVYDLLQVLADSEASAIISGESGTGKEFAARTIHDLSSRQQRPFVAVNAAAIPEGLIESELFGHQKGAFTGAIDSRAGYFEMADGGTLFLDEIAEMPIQLQPKILRVLEDGKVRRLGARHEIAVNVRVLAATNCDPQTAVHDKRLREDLYYRLNVFTIGLPPLRERVDDIALLAQHFIQIFNEKHVAQVKGLRAEVLETLRAYAWPGNVRELRNVIERALIMARDGWIGATHLPPYLQQNTSGAKVNQVILPADVTAADAEKILILDTLNRLGNNKSKAARALGLDVKTIRNKLRSYGVEISKS